jgi:saccharopine dehydrogenase-like NADP-dependent oxidoreductase
VDKSLKVLVLGCGQIGSVIARDFAGSMKEAEVVVADRSAERAKETALRIGVGAWTIVNAADYSNLLGVLRGFDLALVALPGDYGFRALRAAVEAGVNVLDVSFSAEDPLELDGAAKEAEITVVPDCGVAPGLSNILVGQAASKLDFVRSAHVIVGGLPEYAVPPLGYTVTWSAEGLIDEYVRGARIVEGGRVVEVPALSGLEEIDFPGVGRLEAFYTDGLRTLLRTLPHVESMWEKTLRYPGHVQKIELLKALGFFSEEAVEVEGAKVVPRIAAARILEKSLRKPEVGDILAMYVEVEGERHGREATFKYHLLDRFDEESGVTAMARTTAYTASIVAQKLAGGIIKDKGVIPPERLGMDEGLFENIISDLKIRGVTVTES